MKVDTNLFFILSSSCKIVKGAKRSIIIDYLRKELFFITNDFYELLHNLNRKKVNETLQSIDMESKDDFYQFIDFLLLNDIGFLSKGVEKFPVITDDFDTPVLLKDAILKVDKDKFDTNIFKKIIKELHFLRCNDIVIQIISDYDYSFIKKVLELSNKSNINYIELHIQYGSSVNEEKLKSLILSYSPLSHIYIYNSPSINTIDFSIESEKYYPLHFGLIYYLNYDFNNGNICGIINKETLKFEDSKLHNEFKKTNSCLYKKITIDENGVIKNCPSMNQDYGSINDISIEKIINTPEFQKSWYITKNQIDICKVCEFRYNCSDCRAFTVNNEKYGKPYKCSYNPYTCKWEK